MSQYLDDNLAVHRVFPVSRPGTEDVRYGDVPDVRNSYSISTTTMRVNCIACHAELLYGISTIFSFERDPMFDSMKDENEIWKEVGDGAYELRTEEFLKLAEYLGRFDVHH